MYLKFEKGEHKAPEYTKFNPNGRIPTLIDHKNGDFVIWESDAIILYLVDKYDPEKKMSVADDKDRYHFIQWLFFQASGQGYVPSSSCLYPLPLYAHTCTLRSPYFGQAGWFARYHPERIPSAIERYQKEILRVFSVLDSVLAKPENGGWLVSGKLTAADLSFLPWNVAGMMSVGKEASEIEKAYPAFFA